MILLVEDDAVTAHIVVATLRRLHHPHVLARTGAEALAHAAHRPIDLMVVDLGLPDVDGLDLVEQMLVRPHLQDIPVLFSTARADTRTVERALSIGAVDFVRKPIAVDAFATRIERALKRAPARWEPWRDVVRRLRVDRRGFEPLLELARDALADLVRALDEIVAGVATVDEIGLDALTARVFGVRGAALNVGAVRTVQLIDHLWSGSGRADDARDLHAALVIELRVVQAALDGRSGAITHSVA